MHDKGGSVADFDLFEQLIMGLIDRGYGCCELFLDHDVLAGLRVNLLRYHAERKMHPAGVGKNFDYRKNAEIRGDVIRWIENDTADPFEMQLLSRIKMLVHHLNASCYTGINDFEFHYAYYDEGSYYKRHLDRFKSDKGRLFSFVLYLNAGWMPANGGQLSLYTDNGKISIYPVEGRVVFFRSDQTEHEVHASSGKPRLSIAGWLKKQ